MIPVDSLSSDSSGLRSEAVLSVGASSSPVPTRSGVPYPVLTTCVRCSDCSAPAVTNYEGNVRFMDGATLVGESDLSGGGFGIGWGHTRFYGNLLSCNVGGWNGNSVMVREAEWLAFVNPATVCVVRNMNSSLWFDLVGGTWVPRYGVHATLTAHASFSSGGDQFVLFEEEIGTRKYFGPDGSLVRIVAPGGAQGLLDYAGGRLTAFSVTRGGDAALYAYSYKTDGLLSAVVKRAVVGGVTKDLRKALYTYYGAGDARGNAGDLASVQILMICPESGLDINVSRSGYRYYVPGDTGGFVHGLKYVIGPAAWERMSDPAGGDPADYADHCFLYDSERRVTLHKTNGGQLQYLFSYQANASSPSSSSPGAGDHNAWAWKTTVTLPDGSLHVAYTNFAAQTMLLVTPPGGSITSSSGGLPDGCVEAATYNSDGRVLLHASSDAVASIDESAPALFTLKASEGLIRENTWFESGGEAGHLKESFVRHGAASVQVKQMERTYTSQTAVSDTVVRMASQTVYRSDASGGSDGVATLWDYDWHDGTLQPERISTTLPAVPVGENGTNTTATREAVYDILGFNTWNRNEQGSITRTTYVGLTGVVLQRIDDFNSSGISDVPYGWSSPDGLNLVTDYECDFLGRVTQARVQLHNVYLTGK